MTYATPEQFAAATKTNVEAALSLANIVFAGAERFAPLNMTAVRSTLEDAAAGAKSVLAVKNPQDVVALQSTLAQPAIEKLIAYSRSVYEIAIQNQAEITKHLEGQLAELNKGVSTALDAVAKTAPAGSDAAIVAIKSALAAANSTYDSMSKAAKQVADVAVANVTSATDAAVKATSAAAPKARKAA